MSAHQDAKRVAALVDAVDRLAAGHATNLGDLAGSVFGWDVDRVFRAIDSAVVSGLIARNEDREVRALPTEPAPAPCTCPSPIVLAAGCPRHMPQVLEVEQ